VSQMSDKKEIRKNFRDAVYKRDGFRCAMCNMKSFKEHAQKDLDAHHITNRKEIVNGGYVASNGISLCSDCHKKAEVFHSTGTVHPGYAPEDLYKKINSSYEKAVEASKKLSS
jgi:5-methylcytosine-specific restriction endonuclease McrA